MAAAPQGTHFVTPDGRHWLRLNGSPPRWVSAPTPQQIAEVERVYGPAVTHPSFSADRVTGDIPDQFGMGGIRQFDTASGRSDPYYLNTGASPTGGGQEAPYRGNTYQTPDGRYWLRVDPAAGNIPTWILLTTANQVQQSVRVFGAPMSHPAINEAGQGRTIVYGLNGSMFQGVTDMASGSGSAGTVGYWQRETGPAEEPTPTTPETPAPAPENPFGVDDALAYVKELFPWMDQLGLTDLVRRLVVEGRPAQAIVQEVRNTEQYRSRFVGIRRSDGTLRMNEGQYLQTEDAYRQVLKQFGRGASEYDDPNDFRGLFDQDIDANELKDRFQVYDQIQAGSQQIKDAFRIYAGMNLTDDDLYRATVNPEAQRQLTNQFNTAVAQNPLDYATWIQRATEVGLERVAGILGDLQGSGVDTNRALASVRGVNPAFAQQMMDALYGGGAPGQTGGQYLSLNELMRSFEYAMLGSAATEQGFVLPDRQRIEAYRAAGVQRAQLLEGYGDLAKNQNWYEGAINRRYARSDLEFGQSEFEKAMFLAQADEQQMLEQGMKFEEAFSRATTGPRGFGMSQTGRLQQAGLRAPSGF